MNFRVAGRIAKFGVFEADLERHRLSKSGYRIRLQGQPFQILALLLERSGQVVTRDELKERLWAGETFVAFDDGLNTAMKKLRAALSDTPENPRFIETVPRVGYRFIAPVAVEEPAEPATAANPVDVPSTPSISSRPTTVPTGERETGQDRDEPQAVAVSRSRIWLLALAAVCLLAAAGIALRMTNRQAPATRPPIRAIAVLPLQNTSPDRAQDYLADGMTDEIITDLAKLAGPQVISHTSAMQYKGTRKTIPEIARELHVGAVVEGSVESSKDRMRIRVQLIDAATDQHLWAEAYDRQTRDVLQLEADVAKDIAREIQIHLTPQQQQDLAGRRSSNPEAFEDYLQGRQYWAMRSEDSLHKAVDYFHRAIAKDPGDARSYAGLAQCYIVLPLLYNVPRADVYAKAREAATTALALDPSLAEAHLANAEVFLNQDWNFGEAEKEFRRTLELNPNYATGYQWYGEFLSLRGRHAEGIHELETALALDPLSGIVHHQAGQSYQQSRQYDRAIAEYQRALALNPQFSYSHETTSWAYRRQGKYAEAIEALRRGAPSWEPLFPGISAAIERLAKACVPGEKTACLHAWVEFHQHYPRPNLYIARDYADLGDTEKALAWLERSYQSRETEVLYVFTDPEFDALRSDPRFRELIAKIEKQSAKDLLN